MPSLFLLHSRLSKRPAKTLARALGVDYGQSIPSGFSGNGTIIRYGQSGDGWIDDDFTVINKANAISKAVDKLATLELFAANDVPVPNHSDNPDAIRFPAIGRSRNHFGGNGMKLYLQRLDVGRIGESDYYIECIPKRQELRVHIAFGKSIRMSEKRFNPNERERYDPLRWNHRFGMLFAKPIFDESDLDIAGNRKLVRKIAKAAVQVLGLDFGAVDMVLDENNGWYVLEVNTAPALLSAVTLNAYVNAIEQHIRP